MGRAEKVVLADSGGVDISVYPLSQTRVGRQGIDYSGGGFRAGR